MLQILESTGAKNFEHINATPPKESKGEVAPPKIALKELIPKWTLQNYGWKMKCKVLYEILTAVTMNETLEEKQKSLI